MFFAEVAAAAFLALQGIQAHQLAELEEVGHTARSFEGLVELGAGARDLHFAPELVAELRNLAERFFEAFLVAGHAALGPDDHAELAVEVLGRVLGVGRVHQLADALPRRPRPLFAHLHGLRRAGAGYGPPRGSCPR